MWQVSALRDDELPCVAGCGFVAPVLWYRRYVMTDCHVWRNVVSLSLCFSVLFYSCSTPFVLRYSTRDARFKGGGHVTGDWMVIVCLGLA